MPELLTLGLPADTAFVGKKAYTYRVKPGAVVLPGTDPCGVSMEAFAEKEGGAPYLYDFSYGYGDLYFYDIAQVHEAGEKFLLKVLHGELAAIAMPESEKWGGSKVRKIWNRPIVVRSAASGREVDPLDELYGVASQPAYVKHYEADKDGKVLINPYLQVATKDFPAILDVKMAPFNWVIDLEGRVTIIPEAAHPLGRTYEKGFFRPEDQSQRKPGTRENFGHVSSLARRPRPDQRRDPLRQGLEDLHPQQQVGPVQQAQQGPDAPAARQRREPGPPGRRPGGRGVGTGDVPPRVRPRGHPRGADEEPEPRLRRREEEEPPPHRRDGGRRSRP